MSEFTEKAKELSDMLSEEDKAALSQVPAQCDCWARSKNEFEAWWEAQIADSYEWTTLERLAAKCAWEAALSQVPAQCDCSIVLTEGEMIDLQGMESWLLASDDYCPPDPPGRGLRLRWLKILASILDQSNAPHEPRRDSGVALDGVVEHSESGAE